KEYISALDKYFQVTPVALENCVLANGLSSLSKRMRGVEAADRKW
ncbi:Fyve finger-containing protein, partial [Globisporangium polare]